ncbi:PP0621 family protein [Candidatus Propionivibrio aalborgensis]|uniref:PP0621 family protein n=1 Tax=Candidatus Propionivibrio aalborgensis TaxID=1860101 RepID=UPI003CCBF0A7
MRNLILIVLLFVVFWILRRALSSRSGRQASQTTSAPEMMVKCAHCGVNQPISESILTNGRYYCCSTHRHEAESRDA